MTEAPHQWTTSTNNGGLPDHSLHGGREKPKTSGARSGSPLFHVPCLRRLQRGLDEEFLSVLCPCPNVALQLWSSLPPHHRLMPFSVVFCVVCYQSVQGLSPPPPLLLLLSDRRFHTPCISTPATPPFTHTQER